MPNPKPPRLSSSDNVNAAIERVTPDVLALLADGVARNEAAIVTALDGRHPKGDLTLMRLAVLSQLDEQADKYTLARRLGRSRAEPGVLSSPLIAPAPVLAPGLDPRTILAVHEAESLWLGRDRASCTARRSWATATLAASPHWQLAPATPGYVPC